MAKGLLFASFDHSPAQEDEFNDWYDLEHVPERLRVPGFLNAQRWVGDENPKIAVATYDLETHAVMSSPAYQAIGGANGDAPAPGGLRDAVDKANAAGKQPR